MTEQRDIDLENLRNETEIIFWQVAKKAAEILRDSLATEDVFDYRHPANIVGREVVKTSLEVLKIAFDD
jgi:hypothetical protein